MLKAKQAALGLALMALTGAVSAHDLFVSFGKATTGKAHRTAVINNGTFHESAGAVARDRLRDVSMHQAGSKIAPDLASWTVDGKQSRLTVHPPTRGTYVLGVSTMASSSTRSASEFADYLKIEDLPDTLATYDPAKFPNGVTYTYTKHARAIGQAGKVLTNDFSASLGYPLEIRLQRNPGSLKVGEQVSFQVLHMGTPVPDLRVYVGSSAHVPAKGSHHADTLVRTDRNGSATFKATGAGTWYIYTNRMVPSDKKGADFVSDRASLTFDIAGPAKAR